MEKEPKNIPASMRAKLLNIARKNNLDFNTLLLRYFQERFLYRLSISPYRDNFILKGGLLYLAYEIPEGRPTKDIDFLARTLSNDMEKIKKIITEITEIPYPDGIEFISEKITVE